MELQIYSPTTDGFVKEITWNHEEIKKEVAEKVKKYTNLCYTEEQIQEAKADRATLRKFVEAMESKRKEIKKQCLTPYEAFERQLKEITAIVNESIMMIDGQVKGYEQKQKDEKLEAIKAYWQTLLADNKIPAGITFDQLFNEKWLNATFKITAVCSEMNDRLEQIEKDLATLENLPDFAFEAVEVYKYTLDLNKAIAEGRRLSEMQKRKAETEALKAEALKKASEPEVQSNPKPDVESVDRQWISFSAYLSTDEAFALKEFFNGRNIEFKAIKK